MPPTLESTLIAISILGFALAVIALLLNHARRNRDGGAGW